MTTLAYDKPRRFDVQTALPTTLERASPVVATDIIYAGAAVGRNAAGNSLPLTAAAGGGNYFLGFATRRADNAAGAAGDVRVDLVKKGYVVLNVTGVDAIDDIGKIVYATDDDSFAAAATAAAGTAGDPIIGTVHAFIGADGIKEGHVASTCIVYFEAHDMRPTGATLVMAGA